MKKIRGKLTYANMMATIAVFLCLGGAAYAATRLPRNSVGTNQIKKHAVTRGKLSRSTVKFLRSQAGPAGPQGKKGATGARGPQGVSGISGYSIVVATVAASESPAKNTSARCPSGTKVLGGGVTPTGETANLGNVFVASSSAVPPGTWIGSAASAGAVIGPWGLRVEAICGVVSS